MLARKLTRSPVAAAIVGLLGGAAPTVAAQQAETLPRAPGARLLSLPREPGDGPMETSVAVNPKDPRHVIVSYQRAFTVQPRSAAAGARRLDARVAWSADGGESWANAPGTAPPNFLISADPSVTFDLHGHAFLAYIAFDSLSHSAPYYGKGGWRNGIFVRRSLDGGRTWEAAHTALAEYPSIQDPPLQDKDYVIADNQASSPYAGNLYVGWTSYSLEKSEIRFSRSADDGKSWSAPIVISTEPGLPRGAAAGNIVGFHAAVGRDGALYAIWHDGQAIVFTASRDGGRTFEPSRRVFPATARYVAVPGFPGANWLPSIGIDARSAPGRLFVAWGDYRNGDVDILLSTSDDGGRTWAPPIRVNGGPKHDGKDQALPWLAVDPSDGAVYVQFYDRRGDPKNLLPTVSLARSTDGGRTFANYAWSVTPSDPKLASYGDYTGLAALNGRVYGAWAESAPGERTAQRTALNPVGTAPGPSVIRVGIADFRSVSRGKAADAVP